MRGLVSWSICATADILVREPKGCIVSICSPTIARSLKTVFSDRLFRLLLERQTDIYIPRPEDVSFLGCPLNGLPTNTRSDVNTQKLSETLQKVSRSSCCFAYVNVKSYCGFRSHVPPISGKIEAAFCWIPGVHNHVTYKSILFSTFHSWLYWNFMAMRVLKTLCSCLNSLSKQAFALRMLIAITHNHGVFWYFRAQLRKKYTAIPHTEASKKIYTPNYHNVVIQKTKNGKSQIGIN